MNRPFATIVRKSKETSYGNEEKLYFLLEELHLTNRIAKDKKNIKFVLSQKINYIKTNEIIEAERNKTKEYLRKELS